MTVGVSPISAEIGVAMRQCLTAVVWCLKALRGGAGAGM
jgi:hypothetical protein